VRWSILPALAIAGLSASGCGGQSPRTPAQQSATSRLAAICDEGRNELLTIDRHKIQPHAGFVGKLIEEAAEESEKVDEATAAEVRREPVSARTGQALADLARSRAELRAIVRVVQHDGVAVGDYPPLLLLRFVEANGGCFRVQSRKPIGG
jgi:hypothetical protein